MLTEDIKDTPLYYSDSKFYPVIEYLDAINWIRMNDYKEAALVYVNLINVDFESVESKWINHFKGSQHLSNKGYLAYHLSSSNCAHIMPLQWSSIYQSLPELVAMVLESSMQCQENDIQQLQYQQQLVSCLLETQSIWNSGDDDFVAGASNSKSIVNRSTSSQKPKVIKCLDECMARLQTIHSQLTVKLETADWPSQPLSSQGNTQINDGESLCRTIATITAPTATTAAITSFNTAAVTDTTSSRDIWIVKPVGLSCGEKIKVVKSLKQILFAVAELNYKCIVQKYIERPILVRNYRKFDMRQWILVTSVNPLVVYGFSECYARLSVKSYAIDSDEALLDETIHLCNHAIQKKSGSKAMMDENLGTGGCEASSANINVNINVRDDMASVYCDTMMTQAQLDEALTEMYHGTQAHRSSSADHTVDVDVVDKDGVGAAMAMATTSVYEDIVLPQIKSIAVKVVQAVRDKLSVHGRGFEWLGLDLMICADDWQVQLLEVNVSPDISYSTPVTARLVPSAVKSMFEVIGLTQNSHNHDAAISTRDVDHSSCSGNPDNATSSESIGVQETTKNNNNNNNNNNNLFWQCWHRADHIETFLDIRNFAKAKKAYREMVSPLAGMTTSQQQQQLYQYCQQRFPRGKSVWPSVSAKEDETRVVSVDGLIGRLIEYLHGQQDRQIQGPEYGDGGDRGAMTAENGLQTAASIAATGEDDDEDEI